MLAGNFSIREKAGESVGKNKKGYEVPLCFFPSTWMTEYSIISTINGWERAVVRFASF